MESGIIISLVLGFASIVSSVCFGLVPSTRKEKIRKLNNKIKRMNGDIQFFYTLEKKYIQTIHKLTNTNKETIKKEKKANVEHSLGYTLNDYSKPSRFKQIAQGFD